MSIDSKTPETDDRKIITRCRKCKVEISTRHTIKFYDAEGNYDGVSISVEMCPTCGTEQERRLAEQRVDAAKRRAKYEKTLADLIASIPKPKHEQTQLDMGLD